MSTANPKKRWIWSVGFLMLFVTSSVNAVDIYLVYSGTSKSIQKALKKALPSELKVKSYNVDLLAIADYSGKQKAILKLSQAKIIVLITNKPMEVLGDIKFENTLTVYKVEDIGMILDNFK